MTALRKPTTWLLVAIAGLVAAFFLLVAPNYKIYLIHTGSMTPTLPIGSAVIVHKGPVHVGEVITFHRIDGALVTHRLIGINANGTLVTKGDANPTPDVDTILPRNVVGHVVAAPQHVGTWIEFLFHSLLGYAFDALILLIMALALAKPARKGTHRRNKDSVSASDLLSRHSDDDVQTADTEVMALVDVEHLRELLDA